MYIEDRGWTRHKVAIDMRRITGEYLKTHPKLKQHLKPVVESTLSRWRNDGHSKPVHRGKFDAIVLTVLWLEWEVAGHAGPPPDLQEVAKCWSKWQDNSQPENSAPVEAPVTPSAAPSDPVSDKPARISTDHEETRVTRAYGRTGALLLSAARDSETDAALDLGLLHLLDGRRAEGMHFLQDAHSGGSKEAAELIAAPAATAAATAARTAVARASRLGGAPSDTERKVVLLERAARSGSMEAAEVLARHFELLGEAGPAGRWRAVAGQDK
ncbi:hypothetical protein [Murinocardiopsis flavida]|uniref:hypothetical protein n=1 Tax=Murinocardiopsis flavida TaxID=645275 RepID=UPI0011B20B51|nr:hypothetical protein [Murinocardiopsis flavida]